MSPASEEVRRVPDERILYLEYVEVRLQESVFTAGPGCRECGVLVTSLRPAIKTLNLTNRLVEIIYVHTCYMRYKLLTTLDSARANGELVSLQTEMTVT